MSVTVFEDHGEPGEATHTVTCRNPRCQKVAVPVLAPPLPGHVSGKKRRREQIFCGSCAHAIWWAEVKAKE